MGWNKTYPLDATIVSGSTDQIRTNWQAIESWFGQEHNGLASAGEGEHNMGKLPALYYGIDSGKPATSYSGAVAFATDTGVFRLFRSSWERLTESKFSRVRNVASSADIPTGVWTSVTTWESTAASGMYDTLDEWSSNKFTAKADGYYAITCHNRWQLDAADFIKSVGIFKNGVIHSTAQVYGTYTTSLWFYDVIALTAGQYLEIGVYHNKGSTASIASANIHIQRIS